jgi:mono/diheme cytochrome c family protein
MLALHCKAVFVLRPAFFNPKPPENIPNLPKTVKHSTRQTRLRTMLSLRLSPLLFLCPIAPLLGAPEDGAALYTQYCSACHAPDGKGATGGAFPPLAGSEWVEGNPKRSVAIVLKGLHGPVEVAGKAYNLAMPPQGIVLNDDQIVAILNHVHTSWGNKGEEVRRDLVRVVRAEFESRSEPWTAPELLKLFPLPKKETALKNLTSRVYNGQWDQIPDFTKIQSENIEEEHKGTLSISISGLKDNFGIVWEGDFMAPADGAYEFILDADDGARLILNGDTVCEVKGLGPLNGQRASKGKATLKKDNNPIRIEYFEGKGNEGISLRWRKSGEKEWNWLSEKSAPAKGEAPTIQLVPEAGKTVIYRNFIAGSTPRAIGFGFPGGLNLVYSADHLAPEIVWSGEFMDAGRHWTGRGQGNQPPSAPEVIKLTNERFLPSEARFKGYSLDPAGNPTFTIQIGEQLLSDAWKPGENGTLLRTLTLTGGTSGLEIPIGGNSTVTAETKVGLTPGKPTTITYKLN